MYPATHQTGYCPCSLTALSLMNISARPWSCQHSMGLTDSTVTITPHSGPPSRDEIDPSRHLSCFHSRFIAETLIKQSGWLQSACTPQLSLTGPRVKPKSIAVGERETIGYQDKLFSLALILSPRFLQHSRNG